MEEKKMYNCFHYNGNNLLSPKMLQLFKVYIQDEVPNKWTQVQSPCLI